MMCVKPPLVAYLERNSIFNFDKIVLRYVKTVGNGYASNAHLFSKESSEIEKFLPT